ncbi:MAG: hypothetical protein KC613_19355, partial [Myxococcales bacterium]|nr:hypothetical protein [Myxococcales bacterium]
MRRAALAGLLLAGAPLAGVWGHGINGHVHVTGWAAEAQPAGSALAALFADPLLKNTVLIAAAFPDSGYAVDHPYGEAAHWEPFTEAHVAFVRDTYGPDYASVEAQQQVAFLIGTACHGLQDELFDSLFLLQIREKDGRGQEEADPGTDAFLQVDGHLRFFPEVWLPAEALVQVFAARGIEVTPNTMERGLRLVSSVVINGRE